MQIIVTKQRQKKQFEKKEHKIKLFSNTQILVCVFVDVLFINIDKEKKEILCIKNRGSLDIKKNEEEGSRRNKQNKMYLHLLLISWMTLQL